MECLCVQSRRDGEIQLHPLEQREADLSEELHRQKEKERLRKEYIEELKKRHEEEKNRLEAMHLKEQAGRRDDQVQQYWTRMHLLTGMYQRSRPCGSCQ